MYTLVLNSQDEGRLKKVTTRFIYDNGIIADRDWKIQSEHPSGSIIKAEGERMQNVYNRYSSYSSSLSSSLSLSTDFGNVNFTIISSSFNYVKGQSETFITASQNDETGRNGLVYNFTTLTQEEYTQDNFNNKCISYFMSSSQNEMEEL